MNDTFHDDFYDCEPTVDADWTSDGTCPNGIGQASIDTREKLEADMRKWCAMMGMQPYQLDFFYGWLDRQADITEREGREAWHKAASGEIYQAKREVEEWKAKALEEKSKVDGHWRIANNIAKERDELREKYNDLLERRIKVECDCDCCKWQEERDELRRQVSELRELNDSLHARIESAREVLS